MLENLTARVAIYIPHKCFCARAISGEMVRAIINMDNEPLSIPTVRPSVNLVYRNSRYAYRDGDL
jgi:hypothetical protein